MPDKPPSLGGAAATPESRRLPEYRPNPPTGEPVVHQPPLSRAELADFRSRAFELAMLRARPAPEIAWPSYAEIEKVANEILAYILNGKQP